jgi:hypothetical protein
MYFCSSGFGYKASSPDERALVEGAASVGVRLIRRTSQSAGNEEALWLGQFAECSLCNLSTEVLLFVLGEPNA